MKRFARPCGHYPEAYDGCSSAANSLRAVKVRFISGMRPIFVFARLDDHQQANPQVSSKHAKHSYYPCRQPLSYNPGPSLGGFADTPGLDGRGWPHHEPVGRNQSSGTRSRDLRNPSRLPRSSPPWYPQENLIYQVAHRRPGGFDPGEAGGCSTQASWRRHTCGTL